MATNVGKASEYVLPAHWVSALINGDYSGYEDSEDAEIDAWLSYESPGDCVGCTEQPELTVWHDAGGRGSVMHECLVFTFIKHKE